MLKIQQTILADNAPAQIAISAKETSTFVLTALLISTTNLSQEIVSAWIVTFIPMILASIALMEVRAALIVPMMMVIMVYRRTIVRYLPVFNVTTLKITS